MVGSPQKFKRKVKSLLMRKKCTGLICGHFHKPADYMIDQFHYLNSGDRLEQCSILVETEDNKRSIVYTNK
jgi:UDP-2,3-diacylglucosamine pyrophosphatase LpxH